MKYIPRSSVYLIFTALLSLFTVTEASPQGKSNKVARRAPAWIKWSPLGERFTVELPSKPTRERLDATGIASSGWIYSLTNGGVTYKVMSLDQLPGWLYDLNADPEESLHQVVGHGKVTINFQREQKLPRYSGRQYPFTTSDGDPGLVRVYLTRERVYVLTGAGAMTDLDGGAIKRFLDSFKIIFPSLDPLIISGPDFREPPKTGTPGGTPIPQTGTPGGTPPPCKCSSSQNRNAEICYHPKLELTPEEQVSKLTGKIHLTAELTAGGTVIVNTASVKVEGELPDDLIRRAIDITRQIKFCPAVIRGRKVSQGLFVVHEVKEYALK